VTRKDLEKACDLFLRIWKEESEKARAQAQQKVSPPPGDRA